MLPPFIRHYSELQEVDNAHYPGSSELHSIGSPFSNSLGLVHLGVHHEFLPPGRRTSYPHAEEVDEEFVYVISGCPDVWIDGVLHRLMPGHGVGFPAGTGIAHTFINNTDEMVALLVVGTRSGDQSKTYYPLNPELKDLNRSRWWDCTKDRITGDHDALPNARIK